MRDKLSMKAQLLQAFMVRNYKESGVWEEISEILPEDNWALTFPEVEQALRVEDNPSFVIERQFEKIARLLGCDEQDARLVGLRARFKTMPDVER